MAEVGELSTLADLRQLAIQEALELEQHEAVIARGLKTFVDVGNALTAIRDGGLYRESYATFEGYCQERWGIERRHAYRLMDAAAVSQNVSHGTQALPQSERQARPLTALEPDEQREAWRLARETAPSGKITAAHVQSVVDERRGTNGKMAVHYSSGSPEWNTPDGIIERVVRVFGEIDLDPCSNSHEEPNVPARRHLTREDDGLSQQWFGRVYMNPPYGNEIADWIEHLCQEYETGNTTEAIGLVPSRTDTRWFRRIRQYPRCFVWGRLRFGEHGNSAPFPSMAVYLGRNMGAFKAVFEDIGDIYQAV